MKNTYRIIYYHEVVKDGEGYSYQKTDESRFAMQMRYLKDKGYNTVTFPQLENEFEGNTIIVSFDDGFRSVYENAAPIMREYGIPGSVYLPTALIGNDKEYMDWDMIKSLTKQGFSFQAHTHNHCDMRRLSDTDLKKEILLNNQIIEEKTGEKPIAFCFPYGVYDRHSVDILKAYGDYKYILGSYYGLAVKGKYKRVLPRIGISNSDSLEDFIAKLEGKYDWKGSLQRTRMHLHTMMGERL